MTSFVAGDPGSGAAPGATNFQAAGVQPNNPAAPDQGEVVLEYGGRKFTKDDLVKKLAHADEHIQRLTTERSEDKALMEEVRNALKKQVDVAEVLKQIKGQANPNPDPSQPNPDPKQVQAPTADEIAQQVLGKLQEGETVKQREANWSHVTSVLTKAYGDAVNQKVKAAADEAGLTLAEAAELAKSKPKAFLKLFPDVATKPQPSAVRGGDVNTQSFQQAPKGNSGYAKAGSTKQAVSIYLNRLKELGL